MAAIDAPSVGSRETEVFHGPSPAPSTGSPTTAKPRSAGVEGRLCEDQDSQATHTPHEEQRLVEPLISAALVSEGVYYLLNKRWYVEWLQWVGHPQMQSPKIRPMPDPCLPIGCAEDPRNAPDKDVNREGVASVPIEMVELESGKHGIPGEEGEPKDKAKFIENFKNACDGEITVRLDDGGILRLLQRHAWNVQNAANAYIRESDSMIQPKAEGSQPLAEDDFIGPANQEDALRIAGARGSSPAASAAKRTRTHSWTKDRPGPIDNSDLFELGSTTVLRKNIDEYTDFTFVPEEAWNMLYGWYGGGPPIKRRACTGPNGAVQVTLHGLLLKVYKSSAVDADGMEYTAESKNVTVKELKTALCDEMDLEFKHVRIWDFFNLRTYALLEKHLDKTLESQRIYDQNQILLEEQNADGTWPHPDETTGDAAMSEDIGGSSSGHVNGVYGGYGTSSCSTDVPSVGQPIQVGAVGLQNLGNTCFMNSSLQCLSNIPPLREYFLTEEYKRTLNRSAYRTQGRLAESFAGLLGLMWRENTTRVAPRNFKYQVGQFAEQFSGYGQQDSMELIEYVLDGLKEDCNTVQGPKPYIEVQEADGRSDDEVAKEVLQASRARSDSFVESLFEGLFKSVVECPEAHCGRTSVTFDPFLSAKLSLVSSAEQRMTTFQVTIARDSNAEGRDPIVQVAVKVGKEANVKALIKAATEEVEGLESSRCVLVEVWNKKVHKFFEINDAVDGIRSEDFLLLCEVPDAQAFQLSTEQRWGERSPYYSGSMQAASTGEESPPGGGANCGVIIHHCQAPRTPSYGWNLSSSREIRGLPMLMSVPKSVTRRGLYQLVERRIQDTVRSPSEAIPPPGGENPGWKLLQVDRIRPADGDVVDPEDTSPFDFNESKQYFAVEWPEDAPLPARLQIEANHNGTGQRQEQEQDLTQLLKLFTEREKLGEDDAWYCNKCKEHKMAYKKLEFHRTPPVLVLQLKRFQFTRWSRERLDNPITFPLEGLDVSAYCTETSREGILSDPAKTTYDLAGMSKHIGSLGGGHYVAYCRSSEDGEWYNFDDGSVRKVRQSEVEADKVGAYVLFYIRRDFRPQNFGPISSP